MMKRPKIAVVGLGMMWMTVGTVAAQPPEPVAPVASSGARCPTFSWSGVAGAADNVFIASPGDAADSTPTIRIGDPATQSRAFLAGVFGTTVSGSSVQVSSSGQLGVASSSRRFKEEIEDLGDVGERLAALRPVSFRYRPEVPADGGPQVGLVAEEVAEVFPELVVRDPSGEPFSVRYDLLSVLLLGELQQADAALEREREKLSDVEKRLRSLEKRGTRGGQTPWWRRLFRVDAEADSSAPATPRE